MADSEEGDDLTQLQSRLNEIAAIMKQDPELTSGSSEAVEDIDPDDLGELDEEYSNLNSVMDEIDTFMNSLEQKNDSLCERLQDLLRENRAALQAFQAEREAKEKAESGSSGPPSA